MQLAAHVLHGAVAGLREDKGWAGLGRAGRPPAGNCPAPEREEGRGRRADWMPPQTKQRLKGQAAGDASHCPAGQLAQVSTRISTTWSSSPRSDLQPEPGGGAAAEDKAWSPSPWPALLPTMPVSTASRS